MTSKRRRKRKREKKDNEHGVRKTGFIENSFLWEGRDSPALFSLFPKRDAFPISERLSSLCNRKRSINLCLHVVNLSFIYRALAPINDDNLALKIACIKLHSLV